MKYNKVTRLTERDLNRLVRRIIRESEMDDMGWREVDINEFVSADSEGKEVKIEGCENGETDCPEVKYYVKD